ncbi:Zn(II)2Cys6 transcription factor [Fusarium albosuccineum]|uniref:Zn(II)2Cys6 transcription factor n=1 Tax=Fusarium albosuccineum TaxID=1237068 RepID=A0A8H4L4U5_9HYPO|nr:Zn(II)2Cys6 transcription factor [Fusarium albosuccineum]
MPIASQCPLVLNCVLALAAGDLAKYQPASSGMASLTCGFYGQAVAGVNLALSHEFDSSGSPRDPRDPSSPRGSNCAHYAQRDDDLLLAVILLCVHEHPPTAVIYPLHLASEVFTSPFLSGSTYKGMLLGQQCRDVFSVILRVSILRHGIALTTGIDEPTVSELRTLLSLRTVQHLGPVTPEMLVQMTKRFRSSIALHA